MRSMVTIVALRTFRYKGGQVSQGKRIDVPPEEVDRLVYRVGWARLATTEDMTDLAPVPGPDPPPAPAVPPASPHDAAADPEPASPTETDPPGEEVGEGSPPPRRRRYRRR